MIIFYKCDDAIRLRRMRAIMAAYDVDCRPAVKRQTAMVRVYYRVPHPQAALIIEAVTCLDKGLHLLAATPRTL